MKTYTVTDNGNPIATKLIFSQVKEMLGMRGNAVSNYINGKILFRGRYGIYSDGEINIPLPTVSVPEEIKKDWDDIKAAADLLKSGKGKIVTRKVKGKYIKYVEAVR